MACHIHGSASFPVYFFYLDVGSWMEPLRSAFTGTGCALDRLWRESALTV